MLNPHPQPDPLSVAPAHPPRDDESVQHDHLSRPTTPTDLATNVIDHNHTPARPGVSASRLKPAPPQDKDLRPFYTVVEKMQDNVHQVSLDDMFEIYLNCGGQPTEEDLDAFTYDAGVKDVAREVDLGPKICMMGKSVAERAGNTILLRDISAARQIDDNRSSKSLKRSSKDREDDSEARDDSEQKNTSTSRGTSPDVAIYLNNDRTRTLLVISPEEYKKHTKTKKPGDIQARQDWVAHRSWSDIIAFFEAKIDHNFSAFEFAHPSSRFMRDDTDGGEKSLGQFLEYLAQILAHQHRTHLFAVYLFRDQARIVYADRSGAVVSTPFSYGTRENPTLHVFFWKLARMSDKERGFDESATLAADADVLAMREYAASAPTEYLRTQAYYALSWDPKAKEGKQLKSIEWPMHQLSIDGRTIFVGRPSFATHSLFGRCTRGYHAFEKVQEHGGTSWHLRFLKDSWRVKDAKGRIPPEHEVYERLRSRGVRDYVPTCRAGGDVLDADGSAQLTRLHDVGAHKLHPRSHYRILFAEVCRPLSDFSDFRELAALLRDALQAHKDAWEKAGVLHRDISFNNILIHEVVSTNGQIERKGVLSDWDLSKYKEDMTTGTEPRQPDRTGTWYFRSAVSGRYPRKPYEVSDDIESFIHVYHYSVLRFHKTNKTDRLQDHFSLIYEHQQIRPEDGAHLGSVTKFENMCLATSFIKPKDNPTLQLALDMLAKLYSQHYATIDEKEYERKYDPGVDPTKAAAPPASNIDQDSDAKLMAALEDQTDQTDSPSIRARRTIEEHGRLLKFFSAISQLNRDLPKSEVDLFKVAGIAPRKNNAFSSSMQSREQSSRDSVHVQKKRRANTGSALASVGESQEPSGLEG